MSEDLLNPQQINKVYLDKIEHVYKEKGGLQADFNVVEPLRNPVTSTYISDNGNFADLGVPEIKLQLSKIHRVVRTLCGIGSPESIYHDVPPQDWRAAAFDLAQLSRYDSSGPGNTFFVNCAPRLEQRGIETDNQGEQVYVAMLPNGSIVSGVSSHSFAFMRDLVESGQVEIYRVDVQTSGSQFRSRDFFPWFSELLAYNAAKFYQNWRSDMSVKDRRAFIEKFNFVRTDELPLSLGAIPDLAVAPVVARTDAHGNLKCSLSRSDIPPEWNGKRLRVTIKGYTFETQIRDNMFDTPSGKVGIAPGSSGQFNDCMKDDPRFLEVALIGTSLQQKLGITAQDLKEGVPVFIEPVDVLGTGPFAAPAKDFE